MKDHDYSLFDHLSDGVQVIGPDWRYQYLNDVALRQGQSTRAALLGRVMWEAYPGIEQTQLFTALREAMDTGRAVRTTNDFQLPDGTWQYFQLRVEPLPDGGILVFSTNVTDEAAHRVLLERMGAELEALVDERTAQLRLKNRELQQYTSVTSHALKAPLRKMRVFAEMLDEELGADASPRARRYLDSLRRGGERMTEVIEALLRHVQIGTRDAAEPVDMGALVRAVLDDVSLMIEASGATVEVGDLPTVSGHPTDLRLLLQHLVVNAVKYRRPVVPLELRLSAAPIDGGWQLSVTDNGLGIEPEYQRKIFDLFERLHAPDKIPGVGIGLSHCEKIAAQHGGRIWVASTPGEGSAFHVELRAPLPVGAVDLDG